MVCCTVEPMSLTDPIAAALTDLTGGVSAHLLVDVDRGAFGVQVHTADGAALAPSRALVIAVMDAFRTQRYTALEADLQAGILTMRRTELAA